MRVPHKPNLPWAYEIVPAEDIDLDDWRCRTVIEGEVVATYASGPCPRCGAPTEGFGLGGSVEPLRKAIDGTPQAMVFQVPVTCRCHTNHGKEGADGCGRQWVIDCAEESP